VQVPEAHHFKRDLLLPAVRRPLLLLVRCRRRGIALPLVLPPLLLLLSARGHVDEDSAMGLQLQTLGAVTAACWGGGGSATGLQLLTLGAVTTAY